jgi:epoxide hydrolase-like predicted phosphatase
VRVVPRPYDALVVDDAGVLTGGGGDVAALVRQVRAAGLRTALLSNADGPGRPPEWHRVFDVVVLSGQVGLRKPDPRIYALTGARLGVAPARCVVVDDLAANVRGAAAAGMTGVHHRSYDGTLAELAVLLEVPLVG